MQMSLLSAGNRAAQAKFAGKGAKEARAEGELELRNATTRSHGVASRSR